MAKAQIALLVLTIMFEARNQPDPGKELVAHTVMNRVELGGLSVEEVLFQLHQYVAWSPSVLLWDSGGLVRSIAVRRQWLSCAMLDAFPDPGCMNPVLQIDEDWWWGAWQMAELIYYGKKEPEGYEGVTSFDNPIFWPDGEPPWAPSKERLGKVGDHVFYR